MIARRDSLPSLQRQAAVASGGGTALSDASRPIIPTMPTLMNRTDPPKAAVVYIASYGHKTAICRHLLKGGWAVPSDQVITPSCFPGHRDGCDMGDGKVAMLQHIAAMHPGMQLLLVDDSRQNVKCTREEGWHAVKVPGRQGVDAGAVLKVQRHCSAEPLVLVLDFDQTLTKRHITGELCNPYFKKNGHLDGVEELLHKEMLVDSTLLTALLPPTWAVPRGSPNSPQSFVPAPPELGSRGRPRRGPASGGRSRLH